MPKKKYVYIPKFTRRVWGENGKIKREKFQFRNEEEDGSLQSTGATANAPIPGPGPSEAAFPPPGHGDATDSTSLPLGEPDHRHGGPYSSTPTESRKRSHTANQQRSSQAWSNIEEHLIQAQIELHVPMSSICQQCSVNVASIIHCSDCGPMAYFCEPCCIAHHELTLFHCPQRWTGQLYLPFLLPTPHLKCLQHIECHVVSKQNLAVIDIKGRQHAVIVEHCSCFSTACTVARLGLWPSSPTSPTIAFEMGLMELLRLLVMECQISVKGFAQALQGGLHKAKQQQQVGKEHNIYRALSNDTVHRYRQINYKLRYLQNTCQGFTDGTECPVCDSGMDGVTQVYSVDGNFRLARKKSAGASYCPPLHSSRFFLPQDLVDDFVDSHVLNTVDSHDCSDFKAGDKIRSLTRSARFDEKGIFGCVCRHDFPKSFLNMKYGERLAYPVVLLNKLIGEMPNNGQKIGIFYDIACRLQPHLTKMASPLLDRVSLAVPMFHGYGHRSSCQIQYSPRRRSGFGLCDGEGTERLWSYLGKFTTVTKEMTPNHRHDLLVDALLHWSERLQDKLEDYLIQRLDKAQETLFSTTAELDCLLQSVPGQRINIEQVEGWASAETEIAQNTTRQKDDPEENYALTLNKWFQYSPRQVDIPVEQADVLLVEQVDRLEIQLKKMETKLKIKKRWDKTSQCFVDCLDRACKNKEALMLDQLHLQAMERRHLLQVKNRYARGHNLSKKISQQVKAANKKINKVLTLHNDLPTSAKRSFDEVKEPTAPIYQSRESGVQLDVLPYELRRQTVHLYFKKKCSVEEIDIIHMDIRALVAWFDKQHASIKSSVSEHLRHQHTAAAAVLMQAQLKFESRLKRIGVQLAKRNIYPQMSLPLLSLLEQLESAGTVFLAVPNEDSDCSEASSANENDIASDASESDEEPQFVW